MTEPDVHTLTGPYVLDALPDDERVRFEQHLADCTFCTTEVEELREAAIKLAANVTTPPPPALKARVMSAIDEVRQLPPTVPGATPKRRIPRRSLLALAAAALAVAASGGIAYDQYRDKTEAVQQADRIAAVLSEPDARTVHGEITGGGQATVVTSEQADKAVVVLRGLRQLPADRTWQLWFIDRTQTAHSIGLASGDSTRVIAGGVTGKVAFGLTVEPKNGSTKPTLPAAAMIPVS